MFFYAKNFQSKIRLLIKTTFNVHISAVKFASLFQESPCSPVVTFPSFCSEGHGVQLRQGNSRFYTCVGFSYVFLRAVFFFHLLNQV